MGVGEVGQSDTAAKGGESGKKKLTKKEKEQLERELRRNLPKRSATGRNGVFEMSGPLSFTWAAGNVPGGPFVPVNVVCHGHNLYLFEGGEAGHRPSAKPKSFLQIKRADVEHIGLLLIPPLPPHSNVFKLSFAKKQFGHRAFFFKVCAPSWLRTLHYAGHAQRLVPPPDRANAHHAFAQGETAKDVSR